MRFHRSTFQAKILLDDQDFVHVTEAGYVAFVKDSYGNMYKPMSQYQRPEPGKPMPVTLVSENMHQRIEQAIGRDWQSFSEYKESRNGQSF